VFPAAPVAPSPAATAAAVVAAPLAESGTAIAAAAAAAAKEAAAIKAAAIAAAAKEAAAIKAAAVAAAAKEAAAIKAAAIEAAKEAAARYAAADAAEDAAEDAAVDAKIAAALAEGVHLLHDNELGAFTRTNHIYIGYDIGSSWGLTMEASVLGLTPTDQAFGPVNVRLQLAGQNIPIPGLVLQAELMSASNAPEPAMGWPHAAAASRTVPSGCLLEELFFPPKYIW
jgi:hypothetical protein